MDTLDVVEYLFHLKLKYHSIHYEPITINVNLFEVKRIYKALQQDQKEDKSNSKKINVVSLVRKLKEMEIKLPESEDSI